MQRMRSRGDLEANGRARALTRVCEFEPSRTQTAMAEDCDINTIVRRFGLLGELPPPAALDPSYYGDFDMDMTLSDAIRRIEAAEQRFAELPVAVRTRFENSPAKLWDFVMDDRNREEARKLGLLGAELPSDARSASTPTSGDPSAPVAPVAP